MDDSMTSSSSSGDEMEFIQAASASSSSSATSTTATEDPSTISGIAQRNDDLNYDEAKEKESLLGESDDSELDEEKKRELADTILPPEEEIVEMEPRKFCCCIPCGMKKKVEKVPSVALYRIYWVCPWMTPVLFLGIIGAMLHGCILPSFSILFGHIFKDFTGTPDQITNAAATLAYCFVGVAVGAFFIVFFEVFCFSIVGEAVTRKLRINLFNSLMHKDVAFYDKHQTGELVNRLSSDVLEVQGGISDKVGQIIGHFTAMLVGLGIAFYYGWKMTLVLLALTPLIMIAGAIQATFMKASSKSGKKAFIVPNNLAEESLSGYKTVLSFVMEDTIVARYIRGLKKPSRISKWQSIAMGAAMGFFFLVLFGTYALGFWYGGTLVASGEMDLGDLLIVFFGVVIGAMGLGQAGQLMPDVTKAQVAAGAIFAIIREPNWIEPNIGTGYVPEEFEGKVEFSDVRFAYPSRPDFNVFPSLSLSVPAGKKLALVGPSGSGKSSCVGLVMRFYDVLEGSVMVDGTNIKDYDLKWLRHQMGLVSQEPVLFSCSILENILYGKPDASEEDVVAAAKSANAHNFIMKLPENYHTKIGERGCRLSGGQKQRIAIARAILKDPKILLLDEATSALDTESESVVQQALDKLMAGRTSIIIAHRLATVRDADAIAVMDNGSVVEMGTHEELLAQKGVYSVLVAKQLSLKGDDTTKVDDKKKVKKDKKPKQQD